MNTAIPPTLFRPLWARASRSHAALRLGFVDRAAELLAKKVAVIAEDSILQNDFCQYECERTQWVDRNVYSVVAQYPDALGVQVEAGINTRFHRLSDQTSWPRFEWVDVNLNG